VSVCNDGGSRTRGDGPVDFNALVAASTGPLGKSPSHLSPQYWTECREVVSNSSGAVGDGLAGNLCFHSNRGAFVVCSTGIQGLIVAPFWDSYIV
jgi:hypothetical protein